MTNQLLTFGEQKRAERQARQDAKTNKRLAIIFLACLAIAFFFLLTRALVLNGWAA